MQGITFVYIHFYSLFTKGTEIRFDISIMQLHSTLTRIMKNRVLLPRGTLRSLVNSHSIPIFCKHAVRYRILK